MKVQENLLNEEANVYSFSKDDLSNVCSFREDDTCGDSSKTIQGGYVRILDIYVRAFKKQCKWNTMIRLKFTSVKSEILPRFIVFMELGNRRVPQYLLRLMAYKIQMEKLSDKRIEDDKEDNIAGK